MDALTGPRRYRAASCRLRKPHALPADMRGQVRELVALQTHAPERGNGDASALLRSIASEADRERVALMVKVDGADWLAGWYARNGFATVQAEPVHVMLRVPHG